MADWVDGYFQMVFMKERNDAQAKYWGTDLAVSDLSVEAIEELYDPHMANRVRTMRSLIARIPLEEKRIEGPTR